MATRQLLGLMSVVAIAVGTVACAADALPDPAQPGAAPAVSEQAVTTGLKGAEHPTARLARQPKMTWSAQQDFRDQSHASGALLPPPAASPRPATLMFADTWEDGVAPKKPATTFALDTSRDIATFAFFPDLRAGVHVAYVRYTLPEGGTYQTNLVAFAVGKVQESTVSVPGLLTPLTVQPAIEAKEGSGVQDFLPVAGTDIDNRELTGTWTVDVRVDSDTSAPLVTGTFEIVSTLEP